MTVPREYGGPGLDIATVAPVITRIAAADRSLAPTPHNHFSDLELLH
ncbi:hypothetical protein CCS92_34740 [Methylobacterium radiotolerans]|nr:hypothetical protein CCS92_34740 [Methylobacterium radiotolerans]